MQYKILNVQGFFKTCDINYKKITFLLLDDEANLTKNILMKYHSEYQKNPINDTEFYVKFDNKSKCYIDKADLAQIPITNLVDQVVTMQVYMKHYAFTDKYGKKITGWTLNLIKMNPFNYS